MSYPIWGSVRIVSRVARGVTQVIGASRVLSHSGGCSNSPSASTSKASSNKWKTFSESLHRRFGTTASCQARSNSTSTTDSSSVPATSPPSHGPQEVEPRTSPQTVSRAEMSSPKPEDDVLTSWKSYSTKNLIIPSAADLTSETTSTTNSGSRGSEIEPSGMIESETGVVNERGKRDGNRNVNTKRHGERGNESNNGKPNKETFLSAVSSETLQSLMRSLFYVPLTEGGCALGFFTRVCMRDLASQWTNELQEALTNIAGKESKDLDDTWACGFVTSCSVFRKAVNVTDTLPLVSAMSGNTFLFDFDNVMNYNFSDPFTDVAFVQLTPKQIWKAQRFDFNFIPMNLSLYHDIYDKSIDKLINGKDVIIAKQLTGYVTQSTTEEVGSGAPIDDIIVETLGNRDRQRTIGTTKTLLDDATVSGASPAVNRSGELVGICHRKVSENDILLPTKMLSASIAADLNAQIGTSEDPNEVHRPEWMDFKIAYTDLHDLGLLEHPLAHNNEMMVDFVDWPFYEAWYQRISPVNGLTFVVTDNHIYIRPEEEYFGD